MQPKLFKIFPKSMQVSMNPPINKVGVFNSGKDAHCAPSINSLLSNQTETHRKKIRKIETKTEPEVSGRHFFNF